MKRLWPFLWLLLLLACSFSSENGSEDTTLCQPPEGFSEADLVGTWASMVNRDLRTDILVLRDDGLYRQAIDLKAYDFHYESDWLPWRVEYAEYGTAYLYLTGMRLYAYNPDWIEDGVVGGGDYSYLDFCRGPSVMPGGIEVYVGVHMPPGEGVLRVSRDLPLAFLHRSPRGFSLSLLPQSDTSSWFYELQDP
jgi:hypothetical protein